MLSFRLQPIISVLAGRIPKNNEDGYAFVEHYEVTPDLEAFWSVLGHQISEAIVIGV